MKYVITGGAGHISKPITEALLKAGHQVKVIGRNAEHLSELKAKGVETAIGSVEDPAFVAQAFAGADAPGWINVSTRMLTVPDEMFVV